MPGHIQLDSADLRLPSDREGGSHQSQQRILHKHHVLSQMQVNKFWTPNFPTSRRESQQRGDTQREDTKDLLDPIATG